jgi:hypothetical protein
VSFRLSWTLAIGVLSAVTAVIVYADVDFVLRPIAVMAFMLLCPGMAIVRHLRLTDPAMEVAVAVALSIALDTLVALTVIYAGSADFEAMFTLLLAITVVAVVTDVARETSAGAVPGR